MNIRWKSVAVISAGLFASGIGAILFLRPPLQPALVAMQEAEPAFRFFGVATLEEDGRICLHMRTEEPGKPVAEYYVCTRPDEQDYARIREHIGPIAVGEEKVFGPFPERKP